MSGRIKQYDIIRSMYKYNEFIDLIDINEYELINKMLMMPRRGFNALTGIMKRYIYQYNKSPDMWWGIIMDFNDTLIRFRIMDF